jgi:hypothetical protein
MNKLNAAYVDGYVNARGSVDERTAAGASLLIKTVTSRASTTTPRSAAWKSSNLLG